MSLTFDNSKLCGPEIWEPSNDECGPEIVDESTIEELNDQDEMSISEKRSEKLDGYFEDETTGNPRNIKFIVGDTGEEVVLNRFMCTLSSPVLAKIIQEQPSCGNGYKMPECSEEEFGIFCGVVFLQYEWTFTNLNDALVLIDVAEKFGLFGLQEEIFTELRKRLHEQHQLFDGNSVFKAYETFKKLDWKDKQLAETARQFILKNASELFGQDEFLKLPASNLSEILSDDDLSLESELQVFKSVIRWAVECMKSDKKPYTPEYLQEVVAPLVHVIRFPCLSDVEFCKYVLPMNILPANSRERQRNNQNQTVKQRKHIEKDGQTDPMMQLINKALETVKAEQFVSNFKLEMQNYNNSIENKRLHEKIKSQENQIQWLEKLLTRERGKVRNMYSNVLLQNVKEVSIAFVVENSTLSTLKLQENFVYHRDQVEYKKIEDEIPMDKTVSLGFTRAKFSFELRREVFGFFAYIVYDQLFIVKYCVKADPDHNDIMLALCPTNSGTGVDFFEDLRVGNNYQLLDSNYWNFNYWNSCEDRTKRIALTKDFAKDKQLEVTIEFGKLKATATMETGRKTIVFIEISDSTVEKRKGIK